MNVISMMNEIYFVANPMIGEPALPDFLATTNDPAEFVGVGALDQLDCAFDGYIDRGCEQEVTCSGMITKACNW